MKAQSTQSTKYQGAKNVTGAKLKLKNDRQDDLDGLVGPLAAARATAARECAEMRGEQAETTVAPPTTVAPTTTAAPKLCTAEVTGPNTRINGVYIIKPGDSNKMIRTDGKMVMQRRSTGWDWCPATNGVNSPNCRHGGTIQRQGHKFASAKDGFPNDGAITDWIAGDHSVLKMINRGNCK